MRPAKARRLALELLPLLTDGRPQGCKCPPNPGVNALPCDNKHHSSRRCPLTPKVDTNELASIRDRLTDIELALALVAEAQRINAEGQRDQP